MKQKLLFLAIFFLTISSVVAQNDTEASPDLSDIPPLDSLYPQRVVYEMFDIEVPPKYPGGEKELLKYLAESIKYPAVNKETNLIGSIAVSFIVESDGSVSSKKILRGAELAQVLIDALDRMPRWTPGMTNGQTVPVRFTLPMHIRWE